MLRHYFLGWHIVDNGKGYHPVTGRFQAFRHGVRIGANTLELLQSMIKQRDNNEKASFL